MTKTILQRTQTSLSLPALGLLFLFGILSPRAVGQGKPDILVFDEDDPGTPGYYDASYGDFGNGSTLTIQSQKMLIDSVHHYTGFVSGLLQWKSASAGSWDLMVASLSWATRDATGYDSLVFYVNGPAALGSSSLPLVGMESSTNWKSSRVNMGTYLPAGLDADTTSWQRVVIPLAAFQPYGYFLLNSFKDVWFSQGLSDNVQHTIWLDNVRIVGVQDTTVPSRPKKLVVRTGDRSVVLHWDPNSETALQGYNLYRSISLVGPFTKLNGSPLVPLSYADVNVSNVSPYYYMLRAVGGNSLEGSSSDTVVAIPQAFASDSVFLDYVQHTAIDYFWYEANPSNGMIRDRSATYSPASIAAVGFGLTSICVGVDRGWIPRVAARDRVLTTLRTFWEGPQGPASSGTIGYKGWFYHFLDMNTATRMVSWDPELSSIDTGLLMAGILDARQYFTGADTSETRIRSLADSIYNRIDWGWMRNGGASLTMGWMPSGVFLANRWIGYNEAMILYILGIGAHANAIPGNSWNAWTSGYNWQTLYGYSFVVFPPLFGHQYSHCWIDFRNISDVYMVLRGSTYAENSRRATLAQQQYSILNPGGFGYSANLWGLTASDEPSVAPYQGYQAHGAPPAQSDNGTIAPTAPGGSIAFTPEISVPTLRNMYDQYRTTIWTGYGFCDAFNLAASWWDTDVLGIDQGPIAIMIENFRTNAVWNRFMQSAEIQRGLQLAGFTPVLGVTDKPAQQPRTLTLFQNFPNPFNPSTTIRVQLPATGSVTLKVFDVLGREVATLIDAVMQAGQHQFSWNASGCASGVYFARLEFGGSSLSEKILLAK
jgi:hypothetical protein